MNPKKILVMRNDRIGDLILSSCVFRELKKIYPESKITAVVSNSNRAIIENNKNIDEIIVTQYGRSFLKNFKKNLPILRKIKKEKFDVAIDLRGDIVNSLVLKYIKAKVKIGLYYGFFSKLLLDYSHTRNSGKHESVNMVELLNNGLGLKIKDNMPQIVTNSNDEKELQDFISKHKLKKFFCVSPECNQPNMDWPLEEFDKVIKLMMKKYPKNKIILVGLSDKLDWLANRNPGSIILKGANLRMVYLLFKKSELMLGLDTGTTHLAWAGNSNLLTILMPISENVLEHTKPLGKNSRWVTGKGKKITSEIVFKEIGKIVSS